MECYRIENMPENVDLNYHSIDVAGSESVYAVNVCIYNRISSQSLTVCLLVNLRLNLLLLPKMF